MCRPRWLPLVAMLFVLPCPAAAQVGGVARDRPQPSAVRQATASIVGRVVAADSGRPLRLARVTATAPELQDGRVSMADENGVFEFPELPAGHYTVSASKTGYITVNFGQRRPLRAGRPLQVRDGQRVRDIDFRLPRGSVVSGRVLDQDGEPLVRASIRAMRYRFVQGERRIEPGGSAETDDRGQFRIYGLAPGTYFVSATAQPADAGASGRMVAMSTPAGSVVGNLAADPHAPGSLTYAPTYYPGVPAVSDAAAVTVPLGEEVPGIDFSLQLVTAARVTGMVAGPSGVAPNTTVMLVPDDSRGMSGQSYSGRVGRDGSFSISNVPPGRYVAIARGQPRRGEQDLFAAQPLVVSGPLVSDVTLVLAGATTISGQVTFDGATTPTAQDYARLRIGLWAPVSAALPMFGGPMNTTPRPDGTFTIPNVPAGGRLFRVSGLQSPWTLKAVYLDGRDVTDETFDVKPGEALGRVTIAVGDKATTLTGTVRDEHDQPLSDFTVIAFPADSNLWRPQTRLIQAVRPDKDGFYSVRGLPPGEYLLQAVDDVDQGEWYDPELLQTLRAGATRVLLQEGDTKSVDLKLVITS
jgi:hypothetical protein